VLRNDAGDGGERSLRGCTDGPESISGPITLAN